MGQDSGDDHGIIVMLPNLVLALIVFFVFLFAAGGSNYWLNALPAGIAKLGI